MKNLARLTLFFSVCFMIIFPGAALLRLLSSWIEMARVIQAGARPPENAAELAWKALPIALYLSILLSLSYTARHNMHVLMSIAGIIGLSLLFTCGFSLGISKAEALKPVLTPLAPIQAGPGLILSRSDHAIILLKDSSEPQGPRVASFPGRPLIYQELPLGPNNSILGLPGLSLGEEAPWTVRSLDIDFSLCAVELETRLAHSFFSFGAYALALIVFLASLRFMLELSQWPFANLILGALVFRGILALERFLNSQEVASLIGSFLTNQVPPMIITPLVFSVLGVLIIIYTLLTRIAARKPRSDEDEDD